MSRIRASRAVFALAVAVVLTAPARIPGLAGAPALFFVSESEPRSEIRIDPSADRVEVRGLPASVIVALRDATLSDAERGRILNARVVSTSSTEPLPPMRGAWTAEADRLIFRPKYPLTPGVEYEIQLDLTLWKGRPSSISVLQAGRSFRIPKPVVDRGAPPVVTAVFPSIDQIPANQLKFYIHFSKPMQRGDAYKQIRLTRADGSEVEAAFLELGQELWDPGFRRFTLLIDPGRIKRGLVPHQEDGPVLEEGKSYTLEIRRGWTDLHDQPLAQSYRKTFRVGKEDREPIQPKSWTITTPGAGSRDPLTVAFGESLDHALAQRLLTIVDDQGRSSAVSLSLEDRETRAVFRPSQPWKAGRYRLRIGVVLEDLAGNTVGQPFELDRFDSIDRSPRSGGETVELPFTIQDRPQLRPAR